MIQQERELVWLLDKIKEEEEFIQTAEAYFFDRHHEWENEYVGWFLDDLKKLKDQLLYKEHRLENLSWQIIKLRELEIGEPSDVPHVRTHLGGCVCHIRDSRGGDALAG